MYKIENAIIDLCENGTLKNITVKRLHVLTCNVKNELMDYCDYDKKILIEIIIDKYNELKKYWN